MTVKKGASRSLDPVVAAEELFRSIYDPAASLTVFYCSPAYDLDALGAAIKARFREGPVIGCTTAGEITPIGYLDGAITGVSIGGSGFEAVTVRVDELRDFELARGDMAATDALARLRAKGRSADGQHAFGFILADGLSMQEESLVSAIYRNLGDIQLFGGSAGDGVKFRATHLYHEGAFRTNCALFTLAHCARPFVVFKTEHFVPSAEKMVVTRADPARRIVTEINGEPAGREYARVVGLAVDKLTPMIFATHPVVVKAGGSTYVRSIQKVNDDESLTFFCAIDEGIVLTVAQGVDLVENLEKALAVVREKLGPPELVLGCDCILRNLEAERKGLKQRLGDIFTSNNVIGFATYGEQYNGMHVNQTFTGVAIGAGESG
ncbi:MAG: FIST C-terminal domain-containing protein [Deltaproteobacteria bacterium]|nr:FIST C-terminal domain-containing protein [Deltaproteobacteria bacterium]